MQTTPTKNKLTTSKLFSDRISVENAYQNALKHGLKDNDINIIMSDETRKKHFINPDKISTVLGDKSMDGLAIGGALGGTVGGIAAAIAAIGTALVIPGLGIVIAGPLAAGLAGAGAGSIAGGLIGTLIGWGIPEARVKEYEQGIKNGGILMVAHPRDEKISQAVATAWNSSPPDKL
jgi:hypothetical protein